MFRGIYGVSVDAKGRLVVPARYRDQLTQGHPAVLVLTIDTEERCLLLYPLVEWEEIERRLSGLPSFNPAARRIQRLLVGHATDVEMDTQGRILLPPLLRKYASLDKKVVMVGQGKKIELWDQTRWDDCCNRWLQEEGEDGSGSFSLPDEVKSISL